MEFLLLLSALFTALTGVATGTRVPVTASQVTRVASAVTAVAARGRQAAVPLQPIDLVAARLVIVPVPRLMVAVVPAFASRRRE